MSLLDTSSTDVGDVDDPVQSRIGESNKEYLLRMIKSHKMHVHINRRMVVWMVGFILALSLIVVIVVVVWLVWGSGATSRARATALKMRAYFSRVILKRSHSATKV